MAPHVVLVEQLAHGLPERARLSRGALVADGLAHEDEPPPRPRTGGGEQVPVAARSVRAHESGSSALVESSARLVVDERVRPRSPRQRPLLEAEHEDRVEATGARPQEVEHRDLAGRPGTVAAHGRPFEGRQHLTTRDLRAVGTERLELVERPCHRVVGPQVGLGAGSERRRGGAVRVPQHRRREPAHALDGHLAGVEDVERGQRPSVAELDRDLDGALAVHDPPAAEPPLDPVDVLALQPRVRRPQVREQGRPLAVEPREADKGEQRLSEGRRAERRPPLERHRNSERGERCRERQAHALHRCTNDPDLLGRGAAADEPEHLLADELVGAACARALQPADRALQGNSPRRVREERPLEVGQVRRQELLGAGRQLDDVVAGDRRQVVDRPP